MVVALGIAYKLFGGLPWMQAIFYGIGAAVVGIIAISSYKLTEKSISKFQKNLIIKNWMLWLFFVIAAIITIVKQSEEVWLFIIAGFIYMIAKAPPQWIRKPSSAHTFLLTGIGFWQYEGGTLVKIALFFAKAGAFVFGSGLAIIPF